MSDRLDGNAAAGALSEIFTRDATAAVTVCATCGDRARVGALHAYLGGPGLVVRCGSCEAVQIRLVGAAGRVWHDLQGIRVLHFTDAP
jgi:hypothetical protein